MGVLWVQIIHVDCSQIKIDIDPSQTLVSTNIVTPINEKIVKFLFTVSFIPALLMGSRAAWKEQGSMVDRVVPAKWIYGEHVFWPNKKESKARVQRKD